jgi:hypothetical protein
MKVEEADDLPIQMINLEAIEVNITYRIVFDTTLTDFDDPTQAGTDAISTLVDAVDTGSFNTFLTYYAASYQTPEMFGVVSDSVVVVSTNFEKDGSSGTTDDAVAHPAIDPVGLVIAVILGVIILSLSIYWWCTKKIGVAKAGKKSNYAVISLEGDSTHNPLDVQRLSQQDEEVEIELTHHHMSNNDKV